MWDKQNNHFILLFTSSLMTLEIDTGKKRIFVLEFSDICRNFWQLDY